MHNVWRKPLHGGEVERERGGLRIVQNDGCLKEYHAR